MGICRSRLHNWPVAFTEIVSLGRQAIALVLFVALVAAMLETKLQRGSQWILITLLGLAMSLSHYSTTYVAITVIGLAIPLQWAVRGSATSHA